MNGATSPAVPWRVALGFFLASALVTGCGVLFGTTYLPPRTAVANDNGPLAGFGRQDGANYRELLTDGYSYDQDRRSTVAFFPLYPLAARLVWWVSGLSPEAALLVVSQTALAASFVLLAAYCRARFPDAADVTPCVVAVFAFFPLTAFFHMAYSEPLLLALAAAVLLGTARGWPPVGLAVLCGLASATRPVGVALVPVVLLYLWHRSPGWRTFLPRAVVLAPLACSGLLAYMTYQHYAFGDALAFAKTQEHWRIYPPSADSSKLWSLVTLEPVWAAYDPDSPRYWGRITRNHEPAYSLAFLNPIVFVLAAVTVIAGGLARWLNRYEVVLAAGLLLIPYVTRAYENSMLSMARFSAAALPCYLVWGRLAAGLPPAVQVGGAAVGGYFLGVYAALFAAGYGFI